MGLIIFFLKLRLCYVLLGRKPVYSVQTAISTLFGEVHFCGNYLRNCIKRSVAPAERFCLFIIFFFGLLSFPNFSLIIFHFAFGRTSLFIRATHFYVCCGYLLGVETFERAGVWVNRRTSYLIHDLARENGA